MTYPLKFRQKVLSIREKEGLTIAEVASRFDIGVASVVRWLKSPEPKPHGRRCRKIDLKVLARDVIDHPDAYQYERAERLGVRQSAINYALKLLGVTYKKSPQTSQGRRRRTACLPGEDTQV